MEHELAATGARIATVIGRYFAMDRDRRWERNKIAWDAIVLGRGEASGQHRHQARLQDRYAAGETDEFLQAADLLPAGTSNACDDGDVILFFNFRADRARQLSQAFPATLTSMASIAKSHRACITSR